MRASGRIERAAEETGATAVVTTEKDAVKLEGAPRAARLSASPIEMRVVETSLRDGRSLARLARRPS